VAKLPAGWKKVATEHSMWSDLLDDQGRKRAAIFFKAAFYDYSAFIRWECPFERKIKCGDGSDVYQDHGTRRVSCHGVVLHNGKEIYRTESMEFVGNEKYNVTDKQMQQMSEWLTENIPTWKDPFKNW
jgi:hypothetical protein